MEKEKLKNKTISGLFWQFCQKVFGQLVGFVVSVVLARLLMPEEFGIVALAGMFTVLTGIFIDCGFGTALVQKKNADEIDYNTIFWTQFVFSIVVYLIVFALAPWFATLFHTPRLSPVVRVLGLGMILGTIGGIQGVIVTRKMAFKTYFYATMIGSIVSGGIGIFMAYHGWGVWALVAQNLLSGIINTITVYAHVRWLPHFVFSMVRFKALFNIGSKFMLSSLIGTAFYQLRGYVIGMKYMPVDLAYYNRGEGLPQIATRNIDSSINTVLFPVFSKIQDDKLAVKSAVRRSIKTSTYLIFPMLLGLAAIAEPLVNILYTEKWMPCVPFMQVFCISECFTILNTANLQALRGMGEVNTILKLELYKKPVMIAIIVITMFISPLAIAVGMCLYGIYTMFVNAFPNRKFISYHIKEQLKDISENACLATCMAVLVYGLGYIKINLYLLVSIQIIMGGILYISLSELFHLESWSYVKGNIVSYYNRIFRFPSKTNLI